MNGNPFMMAIQMAQAGKNPMGLIQNMLGGNPAMKQALSMIQGKTPDQLKTVAANMAKERGMSLEQLAQSLGINLPG